MAPKPKPKSARFSVGMVLAMALTILPVMTSADRNLAAPSSSPIYHPQLLLLY
jgi:heme/copper-type cytochrome/quinol oxidase subunit 4